METATKISRQALYEAVHEAGAAGISIDQLCDRFDCERNVVHNYLGRLANEMPPRVIRTQPGSSGRVIAACYHASQAGRIQTAPTRCLGIVVGSVDHQILLALRAPGGMRSDKLYARFATSPSSALSRLRAAGLIVDGDETKGKAITLSERGRALVDPDGPLARRRTLNTYCQL